MTSNGHTPDIETGKRVLYWLAVACKQARGAVPQEQIALSAHLKARTVDRFESANHWPRDLETLVAAYADAAGIEDAREIWDRALNLWWEHGTAPALPERALSTRPDVRAAEAAGEAAQRYAARQRPQSRRARDAEPKPNTTRRANEG